VIAAQAWHCCFQGQEKQRQGKHLHRAVPSRRQTATMTSMSRTRNDLEALPCGSIRSEGRVSVVPLSRAIDTCVL
jgi:hypothetical protein